MRLLVSGCTITVARLARTPNAAQLGVLLTPATGNGMAATLDTGLPWAADNGAFSGFDAERFRRLLARIGGHLRCLWVACPDVVGDAAATLDLFGRWRDEIAAADLPVALVGQDGAERLTIPWDGFQAWFIGGSTEWKLSQASADLAAEAKRRGKWVHMGRVNSFRRLRAAVQMGCDSVDGGSLSMFGEAYIERFCREARRWERQATLY